jgi:branched-chain amino acid transport system permease protein
MVAMLLFTFVIVTRVRDSRVGRAWFAIREDEIAAESMGVELRWQKTVCFALSAAIGGMAGAYFAAFDRNLHWSSFQFMESIMLLAAIVLGGLGSVRGVLYGSAILVGLTELLRPFAEWRWIVYGILMVVVMRFRPAGLFPQGEASGGDSP